MNNQFKPTIRIESKLNIYDSLIEILTNNFSYQTCLLCKNFDEKDEECRLFKSRPPARVIAFGCNKFDDLDGIPF